MKLGIVKTLPFLHLVRPLRGLHDLFEYQGQHVKCAVAEQVSFEKGVMETVIGNLD